MKAVLATAETLSRDSPENVTVPTEFRLFPMGEFKARWMGFNEHTGIFDDIAAAQVMANYASRGHDLNIDYNHSVMNPWASPDDARAAGWFELEVRSDGLWAVNMRWTPDAQRYIQNREYRYISPVWDEDENNRVLEVYNIALCTVPAMLGYEPLVASQHAKGGNMKALLAALGMSETQNENDAVARISALSQLETDILAATGAANVEQAQGTLTAWRQAHTQLASVTAQLENAQAQLVAQERGTLIASALDEGKLTPALKPWAEKAPLETLKSFLAAAPKFIPEETKAPNTSAATHKSWADMTPQERHNLYVSDIDTYRALKASATKGGN
jgi:phage I-like protein